jgi:hypothetical protein
MHEEVDVPSSDDDAAVNWLASAVQDLLRAERPREEEPGTLPVPPSS